MKQLAKKDSVQTDRPYKFYNDLWLLDAARHYYKLDRWDDLLPIVREMYTRRIHI